MIKIKNLYLCTNKIDQFYVLAEDVLQAKLKLEDLLNKKDYGFSSYREVTKIELISKEAKSEYDGESDLSGDLSTLII